MRALLSFTIVICTPLTAQTTFAPIGAIWTYAAYSVQQFPDPDLFPASITSIGDTVISGTSCRILAVPELPCYLMGFSTDRIYTYTSNDSVYWYDQAGEVFRLLIPFNAQAGDDWMVPVTNPWQSGSMLDTVIYQVDSVTQVVIDGSTLRQLFVSISTLDPLFGLTVWENGPIVERLGDLLYLMPWLMATCSDGFAATGLVCYEDPEISWLNPQFSQCDLGVVIEEHNVVNLVISPTMVLQGQPIQISGSVGTLEVFDATGRIVRELPTNGTLTFALDRSGAYFLRLSSVQGALAIGRILVR